MRNNLFDLGEIQRFPSIDRPHINITPVDESERVIYTDAQPEEQRPSAGEVFGDSLNAETETNEAAAAFMQVMGDVFPNTEEAIRQSVADVFASLDEHLEFNAIPNVEPDNSEPFITAHIEPLTSADITGDDAPAISVDDNDVDRLLGVESTPVEQPQSDVDEDDFDDVDWDEIEDISHEVSHDVVNEEPEGDTHEQEGPITITEDFVQNMMQMGSSRFSAADWFEKIRLVNVSICGAGGIGSNAAHAIARLGVNCINLYDSDTVGVENLAGQFFTTEDIGRRKVGAVMENVTRFTLTNVFNTRSYNVIDTTALDRITICGFDNMAARKAAFKAWKNRYAYARDYETVDRRDLFIDGRLTADKFQIFAFNATDGISMGKYESEWLFDDSEAQEAPCSYKQTAYMAIMIGSFIANILVNHILKTECDDEFAEVPFLTQYDAESMQFTVTR